MRKLFFLGISVLLVQQIVAPPVTKTHEDERSGNQHDTVPDEMTFEYERYLKEVIQALEQDPEFRKKLDKAAEVDIRSGKIASELEYVDHNVRTKLDELKRTELERLRELMAKKKSHELDPKMVDHLDHSNGDTFEIKDLEKLIHKTNEDLREADKKRREEFKQYEMQKHFEDEQKFKGNSEMNGEEKKKFRDELEEKKKKHKDQKKFHHPGSKQQLEEVWTEQDHMTDQDLNPETFFHMHDLDENGYWDQNEVNALFLKELDKKYKNNPAVDMRERREEMERMREHVFSEFDTNQDGVIDLAEFLVQTKKDEFQRDPGWNSLDEEEQYTPQEYAEFEKRREQEIQKLIEQGLIPQHPDYGHHGQFPPQHYDPNQIHHPGQVPVQQQPYQGQVPVQHQQQYQVPVQNQAYQVPQGQPIEQHQQYQQPPVHQQQYQQPIQQQPQHQQQHQPQQQQYQPPPPQNLNSQIPPHVQAQPHLSPQVINNQPAHGSIPVANDQHPPVPNTPNHPAQAQHPNAANVASPNVVHV